MKKALMIIDMQKGFRFPETESIIPSTQSLRHQFKGSTIFTKFIDSPNSNFEKQLNWTTFQNKENQEILTEFSLKDSDKVFTHSTYNPVTNELLSYLSQNQIKQVFLSGIYTDVSVAYAAMTFFDAGIETFVISDCTNSVHKNQKNKIHESALESLSHILGKDHILSSKMVLEMYLP